MDMLNTFFESSESTDIFLMEAVSRSNYTERMAEIEFMESGDAEVFTESVIDSVKDFIRKITDKVKEIISSLKKKIAEKIADVKLKKAIKEFRKLSAHDLQRLTGKEYRYADWKKLDKEMYAAIKDYKALVSTLSSMKCETADDAEKILNKIDDLDNKFNAKYITGTDEDYMISASLRQFAGDEADQTFKKYMDALYKLDEEAEEAERKAAEKLEKEREAAAKATSAKASAIKKLCQSRLKVVGKYAKAITGMAAGCFVTYLGIAQLIGTMGAGIVGYTTGNKAKDAAFYGVNGAISGVAMKSGLAIVKKSAGSLKK